MTFVKVFMQQIISFFKSNWCLKHQGFWDIGLSLELNSDVFSLSLNLERKVLVREGMGRPDRSEWH